MPIISGAMLREKTSKRKGYGFFTRGIVNYRGEIYFIKFLISSDYCRLTDINGVVQKLENPKTVKLNSIKRISARNTTRCIGQKIIQNTT